LDKKNAVTEQNVLKRNVIRTIKNEEREK